MSNGTITSTKRQPTRVGPVGAHNQVQQLAPESIEWHPDNPRQDFDREELKQLAETMQRVEQLQPIVVRPHPTKDGYYQGLAGERRWRAAKLVGMFVTAAIRDVDDAEALDIVVTENFARKDLNAIEQARAIRSLQASGLTQKQIGARYGKTQSWAANLLRLLDLPEAVQAKVIDGKLDQAKARELASLKDAPKTLAAIIQDIEEDPFGEWQGDRDQFKLELDHQLRNIGLPMERGRDKIVYSRKWSTNSEIAFKPTGEEREQLGIETITVNGMARTIALNEDLWHELQDAALEAAGVKKGGKAPKPKLAPGAKPKKPTTAELRKKQAEADKQLAERISFWRRRWLRYMLAIELCDVDRQEKPDFWQMKTFVFLTAMSGGASHYLKNGLARMGQPVRGGWPNPMQVASQAGDDLGRLIVSTVRSALWPDHDKGKALEELKGLNDINFAHTEQIAKDAGLSVSSAWLTCQLDPHRQRLIEFLELHTKDQLARQAEEWGLDVSAAKTKPAMVEAILASGKTLKMPQRLDAANALAKPRKKK